MVSSALIDPHLDYDSAVECEEDGASVDVTDSVSAHIVQVLDSDFAIASTMDEDENIDSAILEKNNSEFTFDGFSFGNFHSEIVPIKPINAVQPHIEGCAIKIGEISCSLVSFNRSENSQSMNSLVKVQELEKKKPTVKLRISSTPSCNSISEAEDEIPNSSTSVLESISSYQHYTFRFGNVHHSILDSKPLIPLTIPEIDGSTIKIGEIICFLDSEISQFKATEECMKSKNLESEFVVSESVRKSNDFITNLDFVAIQMCCSPHRLNNTVLVVDTAFDPGGVVTHLSVTLLHGATIFFSPSSFCLNIVFVVEFSGEFVVLVFDPGGNRHRSHLQSLTTIPASEERNTKFGDSASPSFFIDSELNLASGIPYDTSLFFVQLQTFASIIC